MECKHDMSISPSRGEPVVIEIKVVTYGNKNLLRLSLRCPLNCTPCENCENKNPTIFHDICIEEILSLHAGENHLTIIFKGDTQYNIVYPISSGAKQQFLFLPLNV